MKRTYGSFYEWLQARTPPDPVYEALTAEIMERERGIPKWLNADGTPGSTDPPPAGWATDDRTVKP